MTAFTLPLVLTQRDQWVVWRYEVDEKNPDKRKKVPCDPKTGSRASSIDKRTWASYRGALKALESGTYEGLGFVFTTDDPFVGGDLDACINGDGQIAAWAWDILRAIDSYAEVSPSGTGVKFIVEGDIPSSKKKKIVLDDTGNVMPVPRGGEPIGGVELYSQGRFFTITGRHVAGTPATITHANGTLAALHRRLSTSASSSATPAPASRPVLPKNDHATRWAEEKMSWICEQMRDEPAGNLHNRRLELGKLAGGLVALGFYSEDDAERRLYDARIPSSHQQQERQAIRDGIATGIASPLTIPTETFPTEQPLILRDGVAHCPSCDSRVFRSKYPYPGSAAPGWYCPRCKHPMVWPVEAYTPQQEGESHHVATPAPAGNETPVQSGERAPVTLLHADALGGLPPTRWLIPGILPTNKISLLFGPPGIGKSFSVLDIALSVAQFANVIYVAAEDAEDYELRKEAWKTHHRLSAAGLYFWPQPLRLANLDEVDTFIDEIQHLHPALVVIDPLADCMRGLNEREEEGMGTAVEALNRIRRSTNAGILVIHHTGWSMEHERGSSLLRGAARVVIRVMKDEDDLLTVSCEKINGGKRFAKRYFRLLPVGTSVVPVPASRVINSGKLEEKHLDVLDFMALRINSKGVRHTDVVKYFELPYATTTRILDKLIKANAIDKQTKGNSEVYSITQDGRDIVAGRVRDAEDAAERERDSSPFDLLNWQIDMDELTDDARAAHAPQGDAPSVYQPVEGFDSDKSAENGGGREWKNSDYSALQSGGQVEEGWKNSENNEPSSSTSFQSSSTLRTHHKAVLPLSSALLPLSPTTPVKTSSTTPLFRGGGEDYPEGAEEQQTVEAIDLDELFPETVSIPTLQQTGYRWVKVGSDWQLYLSGGLLGSYGDKDEAIDMAWEHYREAASQEAHEQ